MSIFSSLKKLFRGKPVEPEGKGALLSRLKECLKDNQLSVALYEQKYLAAQKTAQILQERLQKVRQAPNLTQGQLVIEESRINSCNQEVNKLFLAWKSMNDGVAQLQTTIAALEQALVGMPPLTETMVQTIELELLQKRQQLDELSRAVASLDATLKGPQVFDPMQPVNPVAATPVNTDTPAAQRNPAEPMPEGNQPI